MSGGVMGELLLVLAGVLGAAVLFIFTLWVTDPWTDVRGEGAATREGAGPDAARRTGSARQDGVCNTLPTTTPRVGISASKRHSCRSDG